MNQKLICLIIAFILLPVCLFAGNGNPEPTTNQGVWIQNKGQWAKDIQFRMRKPGLDMQVGSRSVNYYFRADLSLHHPFEADFANQKKQQINGHAIELLFINAQGGKGELGPLLPYYFNYYLGSNPNHWAHHVPASNEFMLRDLYPGINLWVKSGAQDLKYEYHLEKASLLSNLRIEVKGANKVYIEYGDLYIETPLQTLKESRPIAWQFKNGVQTSVSIAFTLQNNQIGFIAQGGIDPNLPLIIDPSIVFLTYSGSTADNFGCTATYGENGTLYAAGITTAPSDPPDGKYPVTSGAFQLNYAGGGVAEGEDLGLFPCDITLSKYSADGTSLLYATYLGGANNEIPHSLVIDKDNNLLLLGNTYSNNFPVSANAFDKTHNGKHDIIVTKFNAAGSLLASTYIGGDSNDGINFNGITNYFFADSYRGDIITDASGEVFLATFTQSPNFPVTAGAYQNSLKGIQDGAILRLKPDLSALTWSTFLGGSLLDAFYSIDFTTDNHVLLAGGTNSIDFPTTAGVIQPNYAGGRADGLMVVLSENGNALLKASYFGTTEYDQLLSLESDNDNVIYVVGQSKGAIEVTSGKYNNPGSHQFLASFDANFLQKRWSTVFGSGRNQIDLTINAFLVDDCKRIYVSSWGGRTATKNDNTASSTQGMATTPDAFQKTSDGSDFYLMLLNKEASGLLYGTYLGGNSPNSSGDHVDGGTSRFDKRGIVYQSMCASCPNPGFPSFSDLKTTPANVYSPTNPSPRCSNAAFKFDFRVENAAFVYEVDTCASIFSFKSTTPGAANFYWTFPDGDTSTLENPKKFIDPKYYNDTIRLIIEYGTNCADTAYGFVFIPDSILKLDFANVFTPNGDGVNDDYGIAGAVNQCEEAEVWIYNRWGQLIFSDNQITFRWNGKTSEGIEASEGIYYYILRYKKKIEPEWKESHGTLTLIR